MDSEIQHISDTALLVAAARASETKLEEGLVHDPYAALLAGERGIAIAQAGTPSRWRSFGIGLRSRFIDEFLTTELQTGMIDCVLSLGAGLDARPWRLPLPNSLRWVEVDFAPILDHKHSLLKDVKPHCHLERIAADVNEKDDRQGVFESAMGEGGRVLLLTEGLLFYLPAETVHRLAVEAAVCSRWIIDISPQSALLLSGGGDAMQKALELRHETRLEGSEILDVLRNNGWLAAASKTFMRDGAPFAIQRMTRNGWQPDPDSPRPLPNDPSGVWLFARPA
jgi:methyltransferase (TIGR00027 family)